MKLDRNINPDGTGKYALIQMRKLNERERYEVRNHAGHASVPTTAINVGGEGGEQFFVLKYRDKFAAAALEAYAHAVLEESQRTDDPEQRASLLQYALEIGEEALAAKKHGVSIPT